MCVAQTVQNELRKINAWCERVHMVLIVLANTSNNGETEF